MNKKPDYTSFFYFNPLPSWVYDLKTLEILDVNQAAIDHYGYTREEFLDLTIKDLRIQQELPKLVELHTELEKREGNIYFGVFNHKKKNGELIRMDINAHKVDYLIIESMMVVGSDVTEDELQIKQLKESEERLKAASSIAKFGYWRLELDANTLSWTDEVYRIWGQKREVFELNFENFLQTIHPDDLEAFEAEQRASFAGEKEHNIVHRIILPDNSIRWVHELGRLVKDEHGASIAFEGTVQDITERKEEEQRLKLLESVITSTRDAVLITEAEPFEEPGPRIIYVNDAFTRMTGYTSDEVIGKTPRILQGPNSDKEELEKLSRALRKWESCEITTINYKKNGEEFWINFTVSPIANEKGWYTHWIAIERDVTEQKQKEIEKELLGKISLNFTFENDLTTSVNELCKTVTEYGDFDFVELWLPNIEHTQVKLIAQDSTSPNANIFYKWSKDIKSFEFDEGLPGRVWKKKSSVLWDEIDKKDDFIRKEAAEKAKINSALGIPLLFNNNIVGVLVIATQQDAHYLKSYVKLFSHLERFIGSEINRKKLEHDLSHLYDAIPDIICITDMQGKFLKINNAFSEMIGYSNDEILNATFKKFVHPDDRLISQDDLVKLNKGIKTHQFENRYITNSGKIIWLSWTSNSAKDEGLIFASAKNITDEKNLRELNRLSSKLAKIGSWEIDVVENKLFWSDVVHDLHETDPKTFIPDLETAIQLYREDFRAQVTEIVNNSIQTGVPFDFEAVLVTLKKNERWVRAIGDVEFVDGKCHRIYGSFQDIHDRKEAETRLQSLGNNLPGVVFQYLINPDGKDALKYVTKGSEEIWGFSPEAVLENNDLVWNQIKVGGNFDEVQRSIIESIQSKSKWTASWRYILPSGEIKTHLGYGSPYFLPDGTVSFNSVILDITHEVKNEALLKQASEMAKIGSWELDLINQENDAMYWSPMTRVILEVDEDYNPSLTGGFEFYTEKSKQQVEQAVELLIANGKSFDEELLITTSSGNEKWIRCIGKSERVEGKCVKIYGSFQDIDSSKSLEIQIREILGSISDAFYAMDKFWNFTYFNKEAENLLGKNAEEVLGKNIWDLFPAGIDTPIQEIYNNVAQSGKSESFEYLYPGDGKWYEINAYPFQGGVSAYFKNIDERKQAKEALEKAYKEKNKILESIGDAFFAVDKNWIITYWNKEAEKVLGKKRETIIGKNLWDEYVDAIDTEFYRQYHKALETQENVTFEEYYTTLNIWFEVSVYPSTIGLSVYFKDVTLRKERNEEIAKSEEKRRLIMNGALDAIITIDTNEAITFWNPQAEVAFGWKAEEVMGKPLSEMIIPEPFRKYHIEGLKNYLKTGEGKALNVLLELSAIRRNGEEFPIELTVLPIKQGGEEFFCAFIRDITQRKKTETELLAINEKLSIQTKELQRSNEELEQFAFITSHDLQEPLRMISSFMDQLRRKYADQLDDKAQQYIHYAMDGAKRMKQIILDLLLYSRASRATEQFENVNLNEIISEYSQLRRKIITEKKAKITFEALPVLQTYRAPLTQVIHSLLDNALKYVKENVPPRIEILAKEKETVWEFSIKDNGIGIDERFYDKVFIIFQRLHNRNQHDGTGIGLSIAKRSVEFLGGEIWLESKVGEGTIFYFTIYKNN